VIFTLDPLNVTSLPLNPKEAPTGLRNHLGGVFNSRFEDVMVEGASNRLSVVFFFLSVFMEEELP
jgi:hypothetical protein